jgi:hypothetical protein
MGYPTKKAVSLGRRLSGLLKIIPFRGSAIGSVGGYRITVGREIQTAAGRSDLVTELDIAQGYISEPSLALDPLQDGFYIDGSRSRIAGSYKGEFHV